MQHQPIDARLDSRLDANRIDASGVARQIDGEVTDGTIQRRQVRLAVIGLEGGQLQLDVVDSPSQSFDFGPEVVTVGGESVEAVVGGRDDGGDHLALGAAE